MVDGIYPILSNDGRLGMVMIYAIASRYRQPARACALHVPINGLGLSCKLAMGSVPSTVDFD